MKVNPSAQRLPKMASRETVASSAQIQRELGDEQDYVVLVYSANNVPSLGSNPKPVAGSFRLLPELKELAEKTKDASVSIVTQGYEKTEEGRWETRRYRIEGGRTRDETEEVDGFRTQYSKEKPHKYTGQIMDSGENVSLFSQEAVEDFLRDSLADYPAAKNVVLFLNAHGAPTPEFGGEAIIDGQYQTLAHEHFSVKAFGDALGNVAEETGVRLSLLDLNTCEMGKAENVLELGEHADLVLASPQNEFVPKGHEYTAAFQDVVGACEALIADSSMTPRVLGETIIAKTTEKTTFEERGKVENPIPTLDLYDTKELPEFSDKMNQAGYRLSAMLKDPQEREEVLESLEEAFVFRKNVVDLEGFLDGIDDPATRALGESLDDLVIHSYAGQFRGRDYSQAGPIAAYMPALPGDDTLPVVPPEQGENLKPLIGKLTSDAEVKKVRRWIVGQSSKLNTLHQHLTTDYPAMLEVLPEPEIGSALANFKEHNALLQIDRELMALMTTGTPETIAPIRKRLESLLAPLAADLDRLDLETWLKEFEAIDGEDKMVEAAHKKALEAYRERALEPVREYQEMDNIPPGWAAFMEDHTNAVVDQKWARR